MSESKRANAEQIAYWNEISGPKWVALADRINDQIEPLGLEAMDRAGFAQGERVLDVGCGCGQTSLEIARRVGSEGRVLGLDISGPMLDDARARAERAGAATLEFAQSDAQTHAFDDASFDGLFSRFGVMFFEDPPAAFANLRRALAPGGRLTFICWQSVAENPWMLLPVQAAAQHVELPAPAGPEAPGPFAFADALRVRSILDAAGFGEVAVNAFAGDLSVGRGLALDEIIDFLKQMGPAGAALRESSEDVQAAVTRSMHEVLAPHYRDGAVVLPFGSWIVEARNPG
ncbi:MAG: class I SAM-dependent methyltransferase [Myxococcota bacterium]